MKKIRKFVFQCIAIYVALFFVLLYFLIALPGSDIVGGTYTFFGFVILSSVLLYIFDKDGDDKS